MKCKISYLYECTFISDKGSRIRTVVSDSFGGAASLAHSLADSWDDKDAFELTCINMLQVVVVSA